MRYEALPPPRSRGCRRPCCACAAPHPITFCTHRSAPCLQAPGVTARGEMESRMSKGCRNRQRPFDLLLTFVDAFWSRAAGTQIESPHRAGDGHLGPRGPHVILDEAAAHAKQVAAQGRRHHQAQLRLLRLPTCRQADSCIVSLCTHLRQTIPVILGSLCLRVRSSRLPSVSKEQGSSDRHDCVRVAGTATPAPQRSGEAHLRPCMQH